MRQSQDSRWLFCHAALMSTLFASDAFAIVAVTCSMPFLSSALAFSGSIFLGEVDRRKDLSGSKLAQVDGRVRSVFVRHLGLDQHIVRRDLDIQVPAA